MKKTLLLCWLGLAATFAVGFKDAGTPDYVPKKLALPPRQIIVNAESTNVFAAPPEMVTVTNVINPEWLKPPTEPFTLGPGDKMEIELLEDVNTHDFSSRLTVTVGPDGKIYYSMLPGIDVWGMTLSEARQALEKEFSKFLRDKPHIGITLRGVESKKIWLLGRFQAPGVYSNAAPVTLLEAMAMAGGTMNYATAPGQEVSFAANSEELADLHRAFVIRKGEMLPIDFHRLLKTGDLSQNIYLQADDFVYMPPATAREVYVMGAVNQPRALQYQDGMTLMSAIANSAGTFKDSYLSHVAIVRGSLAQPQIAVVDYKEIIKGHARDVPLQPRDIVYVPLKPYRHINRYVQLIANTFVTTMAINEGSRAVNANTAPTGIVIPLGSTITISKPTTIQAR
jgi:polysaccharide biosynthesis/export protein